MNRNRKTRLNNNEIHIQPEIGTSIIEENYRSEHVPDSGTAWLFYIPWWLLSRSRYMHLLCHTGFLLWNLIWVRTPRIGLAIFLIFIGIVTSLPCIQWNNNNNTRSIFFSIRISQREIFQNWTRFDEIYCFYFIVYHCTFEMIIIGEIEKVDLTHLFQPSHIWI